MPSASSASPGSTTPPGPVLRIAVLGLGGVGTAAARFLAAAGHRVVGYEQYSLDHDLGSSYGGSRIIRRVYPDPLYAGLMDSAYPLWEELERLAGEQLLLKCGGLFLGPEGHPEMSATEDALREVGVPYERWSAGRAAELLPVLRLDRGEYGIFEPESGLLRASRCVLANARGARAAGAELREQARVEAVEPGAAGIRVRCGGAEQTFDRLVVTAGPWTARVLPPSARAPLTVTRQQYAHFPVRGERAAYAPERFPVWIDMAEHFYGFPEHDAIPGIKVALHRPGPAQDPDDPDREPDDAADAATAAYLSRRIPGASGPPTYRKVCLYTSTPDSDFIVDRVPGEPRIVFVGGLSGHGFKFTILLGRIAALLAADREPGHELRRFALERFSTALRG